jgi:acetyltransferase-like isoleucine patch superfamily enzyme
MNYYDPLNQSNQSQQPQQTEIRLDPHEFAPPPNPANWPNKIHGRILADEISIGCGVTIEEGAQIIADRVVIGDFVHLGHDVDIRVPEFSVGDYTRINAYTFAGGAQPMSLGRNCYIGAKVRLDSHGGLEICDNVGIGDHSQIWTHIKFGDRVNGCRFFGERHLTIERDAWLVGHCLVGGPTVIGERSMAVLGSVITRNMQPDRTYSGYSVDDTARFGTQFEPLTPDQKLDRLKVFIAEFEAEFPQYRGALKACLTAGEFDNDHTCFEVTTRTYTKRYGKAEVEFMAKQWFKPVPAESK